VDLTGRYSNHVKSLMGLLDALDVRQQS
jgi:hypothetical protein